MSRFRPIPTLLVTLAVATMVALGLWQLLDRLPRKEAFLAQLAGNPTKSPVPFPRQPDDELLFRQTIGQCEPPATVRLAGAGKAGFRAIADCRNGVTVQLGTTPDPNARVAYAGGLVTGYIGHAPDGRSLIGAALDPRPSPMMLVATPPLGGLQPNAPPDIASVPNNHLAYAVQWFFFAAIAAIIYILASRRRSDR